MPRIALRMGAFIPAVAALVVCSTGGGSLAQPARPDDRSAKSAQEPVRVSAPRTVFFVSADATPGGDGSEERPWDLATALSQPQGVSPGGLIWLRGGTYRGTFRGRLNGTADHPIVVRQYPGERATIDGAQFPGTAILTVAGSYTWYWGFEIMSSDPARRTSRAGSWPEDVTRPDAIMIDQSAETGPGLKFINLVIHDARQGVSFWKEAVDAEIYGSLIYYNGWEGPDQGHGHGIYAQNFNGTKRIVDNIIFSGFSHGIHAYGSDSAYLDNFDIEGNTIFNSGKLSAATARNLLVGGGRVANNLKVADNVLYYPDGGAATSFDLGYNAGCTGATVLNNYASNNVTFVACQPVTMSGNTFVNDVNGISPDVYPDNAYRNQRPTGLKSFVRPNAFEPGRANITIFNWDRASQVALDLSSVLSVGQSFEIRNAQDFFASPAVSGNFDGNPVTIPMTGLTVAIPVGWQAPPPSGPEFNVFVLLGSPLERMEPQQIPAEPRSPRHTATRPDSNSP